MFQIWFHFIRCIQCWPFIIYNFPFIRQKWCQGFLVCSDDEMTERLPPSAVLVQTKYLVSADAFKIESAATTSWPSAQHGADRSPSGRLSATTLDMTISQYTTADNNKTIHCITQRDILSNNHVISAVDFELNHVGRQARRVGSDFDICFGHMRGNATFLFFIGGFSRVNRNWTAERESARRMLINSLPVPILQQCCTSFHSPAVEKKPCRSKSESIGFPVLFDNSILNSRCRFTLTRWLVRSLLPAFLRKYIS